MSLSEYTPFKLKYDPSSPLIRVVHAASIVRMGVPLTQLSELAARTSFGQIISVPTQKAAAAMFNISLACARTAAAELKANGDDVGILSRGIIRCPVDDRLRLHLADDDRKPASRLRCKQL